MNENGWDGCTVAKRKLHERYIGFILVSLLIGVVSVRWADVPKLTDYIGFALTLASLLLALLAIAYAMYSNSGLESHLSSLVSSIGNVKDIASTLFASSQSLSTELKALSEKTGGLDTRIQDYHQRIEELSVKQSRSSKKRTTQAAIEATRPRPPINDFIQAGSALGLLGLYLAAISFLNKKEIKFQECCEAANIAVDYTHGFLIAASCANYFDGKISRAALNVKEFEHADSDLLKTVITEFNSRHSDSEEKFKTRSANQLLEIKSYLLKNEFDLFGSE